MGGIGKTTLARVVFDMVSMEFEGSRVIITTRDKQLLQILKVDDIYDADGLNDDEALHLLSLKAFKKDQPPTDYLELSKDVVHYVKGLPLAIEILGFEGLHKTEKEIFLHIACFFNHKEKNDVVQMLDYLDLYPDVGLRALVDKSLVKVNDTKVWMHDLLQEMGRNIVHQDCLEEPGKRSRLWSFEDINSVLTKNTGTEAIQGMVLELREPKEAYWRPESFSKLHHLKLLIIDSVHLSHDPKHLPNSLRIIDWSGYPSKSFPSKVEIHPIEKVSKTGLKPLTSPKSQFLRNWFLNDCINLPGVHPSIGVHKKLKVVSLKGCKNLKSLPSKFEMESLEILILSGCSKVKKIPEFGGSMECVRELYLDDLLRPNDVIELYLQNCFKLSESQGVFDNFIACMKRNLQGFSYRDPLFVILPGSEIPEWFSHQINGKEIVIGSRVDITTIASDHILLSYSSTTDLEDEYAKSLVEYDANGFCQIGIRFQISKHDTRGKRLRLPKGVKKCGLRLLYKKDIEDPIPTTAQCSNNTITQFDCKVKRRRDEYDGAGPSGEGSSNDIPHPKRIERPTEFGNSDSEESSEYKDCDEELSDVQ
uniref:Disease resistance protein Roq1-like winged-helix domain-containing protein n=1 Tax=Fagus sylvatica TaxID=28930 RepID=A0A2N9GPK6_FAGSY